MAGKQVQRRRASTAAHATFAGAPGEVTVDTTKWVEVVHDGATLGGFPQASARDIVDMGGSVAAEAAARTAADGVLQGNINANLAITVQRDSATGVAKLPVGNTAQRPVAPANGHIRYNSELIRYEGYSNGVWGAIGGGATGTGNDRVFYENDQTVTASYTITAGRNAMSAGDIIIPDGVDVTVPSGSNWSIV